MKIRKAEKEDLTLVVSLREHVMREVCALPNDHIFSEEFYESTRNFFRTGDQTTVLCEEDGQIIGCASLCYIRVMPTYDHPGGRRAHLMNVYVSPSHRRKGAARAMLDFLISEASNRNVTEITLDATDIGRPLYETLGFHSSNTHLVLHL